MIPITAVFPAYNRLDEALRTLEILNRCDPRPAEILVHVDGGMHSVAEAIRAAYPDVRVMVSDVFMGPGGARNILLREAKYDWVANFDDDSAPDHTDYFARVDMLVHRFPDAAVFSAASLPAEKSTQGWMRFGIFSGCGFVFRKAAFLRTSGFIPLRVAYCMEETDLSLRLCAAGESIVHDPLLSVLHRRTPSEVVPPDVDASILANIALLPLLRYPWYLLPLCLVHVLLRLVQMVRRHAWRGILRGLCGMPGYLLRCLEHRQPVSMNVLLAWWELRRHPECLELIHPRPEVP